MMDEATVIRAAKAHNEAAAELRALLAGRREATTLPDKAWRRRRVELTERVAGTRIALVRAALGEGLV